MSTQAKVLIVRLDGIGDYVLFRNVLRFIRNSARYRDADITLLGNPLWRNLAESFDTDCADTWIWLENRGKYFKKSIENLVPAFIWRRRVEAAQSSLRRRLRAMRFDAVISPQPIRDPFLDKLVSGIAPETIGVKSTIPLDTDALYTQLIDAGDIPFVFERNRTFAANLTKEPCNAQLEMSLPTPTSSDKGVFLCLGASHWTRILPAKHYLDVCNLILKKTQHPIFITGTNKDIKVANYIVAKCHAPNRVKSLAGKLSLSEFAQKVSGAFCAICNDTGSMHIAAATGVPVVCMANGISGKDAYWPYPDGRIELVLPPYSPKWLSTFLPISQLQTYAAFASIDVQEVFKAVERQKQTSTSEPSD
jgi:ADP-heptose:LPS heptosyltransferase